jgi:hypothetical protein
MDLTFLLFAHISPFICEAITLATLTEKPVRKSKAKNEQ